MALEAPQNSIAVEGVSATPPGDQKIVVQDIQFTLQAGNGLGIIGPSGSGKSCLARLLVGVWQPVRGKIRLDGAALDQWTPETLGAHIGYLPQDVELLSGTIAQNIARFEDDAKPEDVLAAAKAAGVHDLIVKMPDGYDTQVGEQGAALSAGQAQRIALARALYRDPFLVVLDEPNSNLDAEGDEALSRAILRRARARRHRDRDRAPAERDRRGRFCACHERRASASIRPEGRSAQESAAAAEPAAAAQDRAGSRELHRDR